MKACIHVLGDAGYVWDADVAHWLRLECGIVGAMVGGVATFKQQNAVHGLPLELSAEEVTLALEKGWGELAPALDTAALATALSGGGRKRGRQSAFQYYEDEDDLDTDMADAAAAAQQQQPAAEPTWRPALASGAAFVIPTTLAEATAANEGRSLDGGPDGADGAGGPAAGAAEAPGAAAADAASRGHCGSRRYRLTGGSKFGADYLIYPGDPTLYHAQFCVRLLPYRQPITPSMLASATRGSHQARKHLLIASVTEDAEEAAAGGNAAAAAGAASQPAQQPEQQAQQQQQQEQQARQQQQQEETAPQGQQAEQAAKPACNGSEAGPLAEQQQEAGSVQLGIRASGVGSRGERYRIHYMTIGPVEGFGG
ncbi:hypothetical protein COHA_010185 [Chlorella ohadii]|uniref:tRNA-intron lyase n=1 Tax=Chlorella ohadii TaxID=2649997 RepID=A0AAD5GXF2_9CHLO|nr:hypothetical protein COHA_010185 [Chlorella ohadii]